MAMSKEYWARRSKKIKERDTNIREANKPTVNRIQAPKPTTTKIGPTKKVVTAPVKQPKVYGPQKAPTINRPDPQRPIAPTTRPLQPTKPVEPIIDPKIGQLQNNYNKLQTDFENYKKQSELAKQDYLKNIPKYQEPKSYESTMTPQMMDTLSRINQKTRAGFQFNPDDPGLNQLQDQAIGKVREDMARRGRVFDTFAASKEQEAAQRLLPEYYRLQRSDYDRDIQNLQGQLNAQKGMDTTGYGRFQDLQGQQRDVVGSQRQDYLGGLGYGERQAQTERGFDLEQQMDEKRRYGVQGGLSPSMRSQVQFFQGVPQNERQRLTELYGRNFAGRIMELRQTDPNNPELPMLESLRAMKILSDPKLLWDYGSEYGMRTMPNQFAAESDAQQELKLEHQQALNQLELLKGEVQNEKYSAEISKVQAEVEKIEAEADYKDAQMVTEEYKALQERIKAAGLPQQLEAEINSSIALTAERYAGADLDRGRLGTEQYKRDKISQEIKTEKINRQKLTDEINREKKESQSYNPVKKWIDGSFAADAYDLNEFGESTKLGKRVVLDKDKAYVSQLLIDKLADVARSNDPDKSKQIRDIEKAVDDYELGDYMKAAEREALGIAVGPLQPNR